jgi:hypothetical protein
MAQCPQFRPARAKSASVRRAILHNSGALAILQRFVFPRFLIRSNRYVYALAGGGVGNRLKHLAAACYAAGFYGCTARAWWRRDRSLSCEWRNLFASVPLDLRDGIPPLTTRNLRVGSWLWLSDAERYHDAGEYPDGIFGGHCIGQPSPGATRLALARDVPDEIRNKYRALFSLFQPREDILRNVNGLASELGLRECIGVHVRKTDMERNLWRVFGPASPADDAAYFAFMDAHVARAHEARFFVVSDSPDALERVRRRYGRRVVTSGQIEFGRVGTRAATDALKDVLLLSQTGHIVAAYASSFSEIAWWWSNATLEVVGIDVPIRPHD